MAVIISPTFCDFPTIPQQRRTFRTFLRELQLYAHCAVCVTYYCCYYYNYYYHYHYNILHRSRMSIIITVLNVLLLDENSNYDIFLANTPTTTNES